MTEPNKESVRTPLPTGPEKASPSGTAAKPDTVRIDLPSRTPVVPVRRLPPKITPVLAFDSTQPSPISHRCAPVRPPEPTTVSPLLRPLPKPQGSEIRAESSAPIASVPAASGSQPAGSIQAGPKNETARISILPGPAPAPRPAINLVAAARPLDPFDAVPRSFCWGLFGIAALIFLIQIWNYVVS